MKKLNLKFVLRTTFAGNTLEWYDYSTYGFLAPIFAANFFQQAGKEPSVFYALLMYAVGSIARPLGGIIFGLIGDLWGRKTALLASVGMMTLPILVIGFLPTYAQIGIIAPIILGIMRFFQGISAGGELPGIITFLVESSPISQRVFFGSFSFLGVILGPIIGNLFFVFAGLYISKEALYSWGWRIDLLIGLFIGLTTIYLRRNLHETPIFLENEHRKRASSPLTLLMKSHKRELFQLMGLSTLEAITFNTLIIFLVVYFTHFLHFNSSLAFALSLLLLVILLVLIPVVGKLMNGREPKRCIFMASIGFLVFSYPLFVLLSSSSFALNILAIFGFSILISAYLVPLPFFFATLFPTSIRLSGIGLGYNLITGVIGGSIPFLNFYLIEKTSYVTIPSLGLIVGSIIALCSLIPKQRNMLLSAPTTLNQ